MSVTPHSRVEESSTQGEGLQEPVPSQEVGLDGSKDLYRAARVLESYDAPKGAHRVREGTVGNGLLQLLKYN